MKEKLKKFWLWLKREILNKQMLLWLIIAEIIFWLPCIVGAILGICVNSWFWAICTVYIAFWLGPFTPAIPLQLGLAYGLKKISDVIKNKRKIKTHLIQKCESGGDIDVGDTKDGE